MEIFIEYLAESPHIPCTAPCPWIVRSSISPFPCIDSPSGINTGTGSWCKGSGSVNTCCSVVYCSWFIGSGTSFIGNCSAVAQGSY